jgi:hypothetical protein
VFLQDSVEKASDKAELNAAENGRLKGIMCIMGIDPETGRKRKIRR